MKAEIHWDLGFILHPFVFWCAMNRSLSLRAGADFQRVWDEGKSLALPLVVLRVRANGMTTCRFAFVAGKKIGNAVVRNRVKRRLREAVRQRLATLTPGWDIIVIARGNAESASWHEINDAIQTLFQRARLISLETV